MTSLFNEAERQAAYQRKKTFWIVFGIATGLMVVLNALILYFRFTVGRRNLMLFLNILVTAVYGGGLLFFFAVKYRLVRSFIKMLKGFEKGLREERMGTFLRFEDAVSMKDGVNFYSMIATENYDKRGTLNERMILIESTRVKPDFVRGDFLHYFTHANILVEYEVLRRAPRPEADGETNPPAAAG